MLLAVLELGFNHLLEYDERAQEKLAKLKGKRFRLIITGLDQQVDIALQPEGVELAQPTDADADNVDIVLSVTPSAMIKIARQGIDDAELKPGELKISGDPIIGQRFATLLSDMDIDWQRLIADQVGEAPASALLMFAQEAQHTAKNSAEGVKDFVKDQIARQQLFAEKDDVDGFLDQVDDLRAGVDRLERKIKALLASIGSSS